MALKGGRDMRGLRKVELALAVALVVTLVGCRPARGPQGGPGITTAAELSRAYQGQARLLAGLADRAKISYNRGDTLKPGQCDVAVHVTSAMLEGKRARFTMEPVGIPRIEQRPAAQKCPKPLREYVLVVSGLDPAASIADLSTEIDRVLLTPERYLIEHGVAFSPKPGNARAPIADKQIKATPEERSLARALTAQCQRLLSVAPIRRDDNKRAHYAGEVEFEGVVGTDGRLHDVRLPGAFEAHAKHMLKAIELWRYQPAERGEQAVAYRVSGERTIYTVY
jgi:hypothetical protein